MSPLATRHLILAVAFAVAHPAAGQDKKADPAKLKEMAVEALKKSDVKNPAVVETDNLIVATGLTEAKAKALGDALQKTFTLAAKGLKFEEEELKGTRTIVYAFADLDQFQQFQRSVLKQRPDPDEFTLSDLKRDVPFVAVSPRRGEKNPNYEALAASEVCRALLTKKGGNARFPGWMLDGFARAVQMRAYPSTIGTDRSAVTRMAPRLAKGAKATPVADKAWTATGKDRDLVAASLMDFLTFGAGADKLAALMSGLVPTGGRDTPSFGMALMGADWTLEDFDRAWRDWLAKGSPANK